MERLRFPQPRHREPVLVLCPVLVIACSCGENDTAVDKLVTSANGAVLPNSGMPDLPEGSPADRARQNGSYFSRVYFTTESSSLTWSAMSWTVLWYSSIEICFCISASSWNRASSWRSLYQDWYRAVGKPFEPAAAMASCVDWKAVPRSSPSPEPSTTERDLVSSAKKRPPSFEKRRRNHSLPPATFLPWAGTMNGSPAVAMIASNGSLSPSSDGVGATTMLKSGGTRSPI